MRLRSSQFVFLLMLACSVNVTEGHALRLIAGQTLTASQLREIAETAAPQRPESRLALDRLAAPPDLSSRQAAAERTPWTMPPPASASAAVASFTSLLRA